MIFARFLRNVAVGLALVATVTGAAAQTRPATWGTIGNPIGGGLDGVADYSWANAFADLMKQARAFGSPGSPWVHELAPPLDANGWPTGDFGVILAIFDGMKGIGGTYKMRFECSTIPDIQLVASPGQIANVQRNPQTGVVTADLIFPEGGIQIMLGFRNTNGGVRNLQVMRPGYNFGDVFTKPFLNMLKPLQVLRFMDWSSTNWSPVVNWSDRRLPSSPSYAGFPGVPWEVCIDLCNLLGKDAYINVPHMATDDYVRQLAILFRDRLRPDLKLYVEYSNEVWNWQFAQSHWNLAQAKAEVQAGNSPLNYDGSTNEGVWAARRVGLRLKQIVDIFREVQLGHRRRDLRPILGTMVGWPDLWMVEPLKMLNDVYGPPANYIYAVGLAPYFNLGPDQEREGMTVDQVLAFLQRSVDEWKTSIWFESCFATAYTYGLKVVAYEGGPDTFGPGSIEAKAQANMDPRIQAICEDYLRMWYGYGGDVFNWFVVNATNYNTQYGAWGTTNDWTRPDSPKNRAIRAVAESRKFPLTRGQVIPGDVDPRQVAWRDQNWASTSHLSLTTWDWRGPHKDILLRSLGNRQYRIRFFAQTWSENARLRVSIGNRLVGEVPLVNGPNFVWTAPLTATIADGMTAMRMTIVPSGTASAAVDIRNIRFEAL